MSEKEKNDLLIRLMNPRNRKNVYGSIQAELAARGIKLKYDTIVDAMERRRTTQVRIQDAIADLLGRPTLFIGKRKPIDEMIIMYCKLIIARNS